jgi:hypothetical protein
MPFPNVEPFYRVKKVAVLISVNAQERKEKSQMLSPGCFQGFGLSISPMTNIIKPKNKTQCPFRLGSENVPTKLLLLLPFSCP